MLELKLRSLVEIGVFSNVGDFDGDSQFVWFIWYVFLENDLLDPSFVVHVNFGQDATILLILNSDIDSQESVVPIFSHSSD